MDVVKVNGIPFLVTISRVVKLGLAAELINTKMLTIVSALLIIMGQYKAREFNTSEIAADYAYKPMH